MDHAGRRERLAAQLRRRDVDVAVITRLVNVRYLCGFTGSNGALLVGTDGSAVLVTDGRYPAQARAQAPDVEVAVAREAAPAALARARAAGARRVALEHHDVTLELHAALVREAEGVALSDLDRGVERLRVVKDDDEVALLRSACEISDAALADVLATVRPGDTEREIAWRLVSGMRALGADGPAFPVIVASGPHSAIPHHAPTDRPVQPGDLLKLDFGALVAGYHADVTRTAVVGPPADWQRDLHALVAAAQRAGRDALRAGAEPQAVHGAAKDVITAAGETLPHGLGHGVGLEIHEAPMLASPGEPLQPGVCATVEPGVYLEGRGGVRIEDTLLVTAAEALPLSRAPRDLLVL